MFQRLAPVLRGAIAAILLGLNTLLCCSALFAIALLKLVVPIERSRPAIEAALNETAARWISGNAPGCGPLSARIGTLQASRVCPTAAGGTS